MLNTKFAIAKATTTMTSATNSSGSQATSWLSSVDTGLFPKAPNASWSVNSSSIAYTTRPSRSLSSNLPVKRRRPDRSPTRSRPTRLSSFPTRRPIHLETNQPMTRMARNASARGRNATTLSIMFWKLCVKFIPRR